jgi:hypothetical protein
MKIKILIDDSETYQWEFNLYDGFELTDGTFSAGLKTAKRYEIPDVEGYMNGTKELEVFDVTFEDIIIGEEKRLKEAIESQGFKSRKFRIVR